MAEREPSKMSSNDALVEALNAREKFLKEQPHLQSFQDEIDRILEKTVGFENRMSVLAFMIEKKLYELKDAFDNLRTATLKAQSISSEAKTEHTGQALDHSEKSEGYFN